MHFSSSLRPTLQAAQTHQQRACRLTHPKTSYPPAHSQPESIQSFNSQGMHEHDLNNLSSQNNQLIL